MEDLGIVLLALHLLADSPLQTDQMAHNKFGGGPALVAHVSVHLSLYLIVLSMIYGVVGALVGITVAVFHYVIDHRRWAEPKEGFEDYPVWVDQSLHIAIIALVVVVT